MLGKLQNFTVWNFYRDRHIHHQTLKGSHIVQTAPCSNLFRVHLCTCVCACFSLPVSGSKAECCLDENPNCFTWSQDEAGFAFCAHVWLLGTDQQKRKEPETGCGAGQKGVTVIGGDCLASSDMRDAGTVPCHLLRLISILWTKKAWKVVDFPMG